MTIQKWSDEIIVAELSDDPQFSEEMTMLMDMLKGKCVNVALNFAAISHLNSSNISALLRLRKRTLSDGRKLILCGVNSQVFGVFGVTGLDRLFEFTDEMATALAAIQLADQPKEAD